VRQSGSGDVHSAKLSLAEEGGAAPLSSRRAQTRWCNEVTFIKTYFGNLVNKVTERFLDLTKR
jgi:hypothetical protein